MFRFQLPLTIVGVVLIVLLLISGIALLRSAKNSLKLSNTYCGLSILLKIVLLIIIIFYFAPAYADFFAQLGENDSPMFNALKASVTAGMYSPVLVVIYPIVCLIMLNSKVVKHHLATRA